MKKLLTLLTISTLTLSGIVAGGSYLLTNNPNQVLSTNNYQQQKQKETNPQLKEQPHKYDGTKVIEIGWITLKDGTVQIPTFNKYTTEVPAYLPPFITNLNGAFSQLESSSVKNLDKWDTSNVTNMRSMFIYAEKFNQDISNWNTSNVTNMKRMFYGADNFNQPIGNWNTSNVTNMEFMFYRADAFNQDISNWNVNNVTKWSHFDWNYGNYYRPHQIPPKFRNYNPNNTKTLSIALGIVGGVVGISVLASTIYLYKRKKINQ
ncbi:BspA family leucine-rich repeat surface protein [Mycoplasma capricolum subsp. capricolum]|uniref:BspA family leucine-rich repeat surface protein n=1 Tax=Mycoplasma capricolum TaxID=2095 RepID=UPI003DA3D2FB